MQKLLVSTMALGALLVCTTVAVALDGISIQVSPNVINIASQSEVVTVHTDIAYSLVQASTVTLNGIEIDSWKADDRGNFVAKFLAKDVKGIVEAGKTAELTLAGFTNDGFAFSGTDHVKVIEVKGR